MQKFKEMFIEKSLLCKLFYIFVILWCTIAAFCSMKTICAINIKNTLIVFLFLVMFIYISILIIKKINTEKKYITLITLLFIITLGLSARIVSNYIFKTIPTSDFKAPHVVYHEKDNGIFNKVTNSAEQSLYQTYYSTFPAWFPYMKVVSLVYDVFGENVLNIKIMNWIFYVASTILMYIILKDKSPKNGLFAALLFSLFPSLILYSNLTTPDHITIFLFLFYIYTWKKLLKSRKESEIKSIIKYSILNIISMCLINLFKPLSILGILIFICAEIICYFPEILDNKKRLSYFKKNIPYIIAFIIIGLGALKIESIILNKTVEKTINVKVVDSTGLYMLWGYSIDEKGNYNSNPANKIYDELLKKNNNNIEKTMKETNVLAKEQFKRNFKYLPSIIWQKFNIAYHTEKDIFSWANYSENAIYSQNIKDKYSRAFEILANSYMSIILIMTSIALFKNSQKKYIDNLVVVISLIVTGYTCILVFGGVQPRYKTLILAPFCILASTSVIFKKEDEEKC